MLKRKAIASIKNWVNTKNKKCLVVQGARQTGKTYIIERFAEDNYEELLEINFKQMVSAVDIFSGDLTVDNMVMAMRFRFPEKKILPGKTLIFLDEIQECQEAITSLKFWAIDNRYDVIVSGSLLGIDYKRASSYPVGYVDYLRMYGIDFEEFLWGMGISEDMIGNLCGYLESKTVIPEAIHSQMMNYYRQYIAIGGMPEAVQKYIDTKDFRKINQGIYGAINFNNMIPVVESALLLIDIDAMEDSKYQRLLQNQYKCIKADREQIQLTAKRLRDTLFKKDEELNGNDKRIKERCCDLPLLEEVVKHYDNH